MAAVSGVFRRTLLPAEILEVLRQPFLRPTLLHHHFSQPTRIASAALPALGTTFSNLGDLIGEIWDSVLKAVPKKKQTYGRKRDRQLNGKALKDVQRVVPCSSCGRPKRPHVVCNHCLTLIREMWSGTYNLYKAEKPKTKSEPAASRFDGPALKAPKPTAGKPADAAASTGSAPAKRSSRTKGRP